MCLSYEIDLLLLLLLLLFLILLLKRIDMAVLYKSCPVAAKDGLLHKGNIEIVKKVVHSLFAVDWWTYSRHWSLCTL